MKTKIPTNGICFWGFSALERFAISNASKEKITFLDADESLNESKLGFEFKDAHLFNLTPLNVEYLRPIFRKLQKEKIPFGLCTDVNSLTFLWLKEDNFQEDVKFYYKDEKFIYVLTKLLETGSFDSKTACHPWSDFGMSDRQLEIFKMVVSGASNKAIAEGIFQSEKTVEAEISKIAKKLKIETKASSKENPRVMFVRKYAQILNII